MKIRTGEIKLPNMALNTTQDCDFPQSLHLTVSWHTQSLFCIALMVFKLYCDRCVHAMTLWIFNLCLSRLGLHVCHLILVFVHIDFTLNKIICARILLQPIQNTKPSWIQWSSKSRLIRPNRSRWTNESSARSRLSWARGGLQPVHLLQGDNSWLTREKVASPVQPMPEADGVASIFMPYLCQTLTREPLPTRSANARGQWGNLSRRAHARGRPSALPGDVHIIGQPEMRCSCQRMTRWPSRSSCTSHTQWDRHQTMDTLPGSPASTWQLEPHLKGGSIMAAPLHYNSNQPMHESPDHEDQVLLSHCRHTGVIYIRLSGFLMNNFQSFVGFYGLPFKMWRHGQKRSFP